MSDRKGNTEPSIKDLKEEDYYMNKRSHKTRLNRPRCQFKDRGLIHQSQMGRYVRWCERCAGSQLIVSCILKYSQFTCLSSSKAIISIFLSIKYCLGYYVLGSLVFNSKLICFSYNFIYIKCINWIFCFWNNGYRSVSHFIVPKIDSTEFKYF